MPEESKPRNPQFDFYDFAFQVSAAGMPIDADDDSVLTVVELLVWLEDLDATVWQLNRKVYVGVSQYGETYMDAARQAYKRVIKNKGLIVHAVYPSLEKDDVARREPIPEPTKKDE